MTTSSTTVEKVFLDLGEKRNWSTLVTLHITNVLKLDEFPDEFEKNLEIGKFEFIDENLEFVKYLSEPENLARTPKAVELFNAKPITEANYDSTKGELDWFPLNRPLSWDGWNNITPVMDLTKLRLAEDVISIVNSMTDDEVLNRTNFTTLNHGVQLMTNKKHLVVETISNNLALGLLTALAKDAEKPEKTTLIETKVFDVLNEFSELESVKKLNKYFARSRFERPVIVWNTDDYTPWGTIITYDILNGNFDDGQLDWATQSYNWLDGMCHDIIKKFMIKFNDRIEDDSLWTTGLNTIDLFDDVELIKTFHKMPLTNDTLQKLFEVSKELNDDRLLDFLLNHSMRKRDWKEKAIKMGLYNAKL
jgi:hypothetical protein